MKNYAAILILITGLIFLPAYQARAEQPNTAPINDDLESATPIVLNSDGDAFINGSNVEATKQAGEPDHARNGGGKSVWYKITPTVTRAFAITATLNNFDPTLGVYTGNSVGGLQLVGYNDDYNTTGGGAPRINLMLVAGTTYYIAVDGYNGGAATAQGSFKLYVLNRTMLDNDNFANIWDLGSFSANSIAGTNFGATREGGEPVHFNQGDPAIKSVWYKWTATASVSMRFELTENFDSIMCIYRANNQNPAIGDLIRIPNTNSIDRWGYTPDRYSVTFFAEAGKTYYIAVAADSISENQIHHGNFQLEFERNLIRYSTDYASRFAGSSVSLFRPSSGVWHNFLGLRSTTPQAVSWGQTGDTPVAADFDGDGTTDLAVARNQGAVKNWYINNSTAGIGGLQWGTNTDRAITGDFDGDGRADVGVMRLTQNGYAWYIRRSANGWLVSFLFGTTGDKPVFGDFDGDGRTEIAVVRNGQNGLTWYMLKSSTGYQQFAAQQFGTAGDVPVAEDYDGDGKSDIAVFRPSNGYWYILQSSNGALDFKAFGQTGDKPQPADYEGDGKANVAVFRPSTGTWYIAKPTGEPAQNFEAFQYGAADDVPMSSMTTLSQ